MKQFASENSLNPQSADKQINATINPDFEFKTLISEEDIKSEAEQQARQAADSQRIIGLFEFETANAAINSALTMPDPVYLYDVLIQENELIILFADTGVGKTVYAFQAAISIANNGYRVLFLDLELSKKQFQKRYTSVDGHPYMMPETLFRVEYARLSEVPHELSYTDFFFESLRRLIDETSAQVVFIDNLTKLAAGDTDSAKATIPILEGLNRLKFQNGITIIAIEHNKKVDATRPIQLNDLQGSKMKSNLVDSVFTIGRSATDKNLRYVKQVKVRDGELRYDTDNVMTLEISKERGFFRIYGEGLCKRVYASETDERKRQGIYNSKD